MPASSATSPAEERPRPEDRGPRPLSLAAVPRALLFVLAAALTVMALLYSGAWMYVYYEGQTPDAPVELGFDIGYRPAVHATVITNVWPGGPALAAGLQVNDRITAVNGIPLTNSDEPRLQAWNAGRPGAPVDLTIERPGEAQPRIVRAVFRANGTYLSRRARTLMVQINGSFPMFFLLVGFPVLFLRLQDRNAWLLALLFAAFAATPGSAEAFPAPLRGFSMTYRAILDTLLGPMFYLFFAVFPERGRLDRRWPWLKWALFATALVFIVPGLRVGDPRPPHFLIAVLGDSAANMLRLVYLYGVLILGLASLVSHARSGSIDTRRKVRVVIWGALVGLTPVLVAKTLEDFGVWRQPFWVSQTVAVLVFIFPISFAYAVVKHRVLEIPVLLKRSARYVLVKRGFAVLVVVLAVAADVLFTVSSARMFRMDASVGMSVGVGFGIVLAWLSSPVLRDATEHIDRRFFRGAYDVRQILQELAEKVRIATSRDELAELLQQQLTRALHPSSMAVYLRANGYLYSNTPGIPLAARQVAGEQPELLALARNGRPQDVTASDAGVLFAPLRPECLVPLLGRGTELLGVAVLGARLSEEPYSAEDRALLHSVAGQAGIALENIGLAEGMAERMDAERRVAQEMQIAREVQRKLLPQQAPPLITLDYAGECLQARAVGGDYYDFLDLGPGRIGFVLADVAGKGISAALLMANLQANLRSQYAMALEDPRRLLCAVNQLFFTNTEENRYATMFFAGYDDQRRVLQYINCGHNPPILLRRGGAVERLTATATVLGLFAEWYCELAEVEISAGDLLVIFTDGVTEATDPAGEEFGEQRLLDLIRSQGADGAEGMLRRVQAEVLRFSPGEQQDDLTLLVAFGR